MEIKIDTLEGMTPCDMEAYKRAGDKHSSTKSGCNKRSIARRRKRNKNKKTHR